MDDKQEEIAYIKKALADSQFSTATILTKNLQCLEEFKKAFFQDQRIHLLTMNEAQGVEFDIVFLVGLDEHLFSVRYNVDVSIELIEEKKRINKDLLYVASTRAITQLHLLVSIDTKLISPHNS